MLSLKQSVIIISLSLSLSLSLQFRFCQVKKGVNTILWMNTSHMFCVDTASTH